MKNQGGLALEVIKPRVERVEKILLSYKRIHDIPDGFTHVFLKPKLDGEIVEAFFSRILEPGRIPYDQNFKPKNNKGMHFKILLGAERVMIPLGAKRTPAGFDYEGLKNAIEWQGGGGQ